MVNTSSGILFNKVKEMMTKMKNTSNAAKAEYSKALGMSLKAQGQDAAAIPHLIDALANDSSLADVHFTLAMMAQLKPDLKIDMEAINKKLKNKKILLHSYSVIMDVLRSKKQYKEAVLCQKEICRLEPKDSLAMIDLGLLLKMTGEIEESAVTASKGLNLNPGSPLALGVFSTSLTISNFKSFHPEVKKALLECFKHPYKVNLSRTGQAWLALMMADPVFDEFSRARTITTDLDFKIWADSLDENTGAFLKDPYLIEGLRRILVCDPLIENALRNLRHYLCINLENLIENGRISLFESFLYALAEQCFFNEYIYAENDHEAAIIKTLYDSSDKIKIGLLACYHPLHSVAKDRAASIKELGKGDENFLSMTKVHLDEPLEEEAIKANLPTVGQLANAISLAVQEQYEEHPYPRWTTTVSSPLPNDDSIFDSKSRNLPLKILIAGCGTGQHAISSTIRNPNARVTAIDLSRSSLAYAQRKAKECGIGDRIRFVHADILSMQDWPEEFDVIESAGVLHHMEDPFLGWSILNKKLKDNGLFKIGLYSETARKPVVMAREFIKEYNYPSTLEGIRACRQALFAMPVTNPIRKFCAGSLDFYSTSLTRDLIFHVQEHRMTLPQINDMLSRLNLKCLKFVVQDSVMARNYDKMFPDDPRRASLDNWHIYEQQFPNAFISMYQFWCQKTG